VRIDIDDDLQLAIAAARRAGAVTLRHFGTDLVVRMKGEDQPLTDADLEADAVLHEDLAGNRPAYGWLSEESVDGPDRLGRRRVWIVDPIDGTRSFVAARPEYTVSVGLAEDGDAVVGVVYNPARDELFWALRGAGAWLQERGGAPRRLAVGTGAARRILASRAEIAAGELDPFGDEWSIEPQGSTAYKLALVAAGSAEAFVSRGPKSEWDICAGVLIVAEAGGVATDLEGRVVSFNRPDPYVHGMVCAGAPLHAGLLTRVAALPPTQRLRET
jgi:myo-inositol-1(or 4)-monophosphatase